MNYSNRTALPNYEPLKLPHNHYPTVVPNYTQTIADRKREVLAGDPYLWKPKSERIASFPSSSYNLNEEIREAQLSRYESRLQSLKNGKCIFQPTFIPITNNPACSMMKSFNK